MNTLQLKLNLDNNVWAMSPPDFLSFKQKVEGIKQDLSTYTVTGQQDDCDNCIDDNGNCIININGEFVRGTGLPAVVCDMIGIVDLDNLDAQLIQIRDNPGICNKLFLNITSPGGTTHTHATALLIRQIAQQIDVIGYVGSMACSAGYLLASQCSELYVSETAWIGFVGTIFTRADITQANNIAGVNYTFITSSPKKLYLNPNVTATKEELEWIESAVIYSYEMFVDDVLTNRNIAEQYLDSSIFIGEQGVNLNFADGIVNNFNDLIKNHQ
jgi:ClpP class serine protease